MKNLASVSPQLFIFSHGESTSHATMSGLMNKIEQKLGDHPNVSADSSVKPNSGTGKDANDGHSESLPKAHSWFELLTRHYRCEQVLGSEHRRSRARIWKERSRVREGRQHNERGYCLGGHRERICCRWRTCKVTDLLMVRATCRDNLHVVRSRQTSEMDRGVG